MAKTAIEKEIGTILRKADNLLKEGATGLKLGFESSTTNTQTPDSIISRYVDRIADIRRLQKRPSVRSNKKLMAQLDEALDMMSDGFVKLNSLLGDQATPDRWPDMSSDLRSTMGSNAKANAKAQLNPEVRNPMPGLIGSEIATPEPDPRFPPKASQAGGAAPQVVPKTAPQTIGGPRGKQVASALPPWTEVPKPASVYGMNPSNTRAPALDPRSMVPSATPMPSGAGNLGAGNGMYNFPKGTTTNAGADRLAEMYPEKTRADKQRKKAADAAKRAQKKAIDKTLGMAGKLGRGAVMGLPLLALDYLAPNNAIAASRNEGYGMLDDMGIDIQGGIDSIDNPWLSGGASLLDGLLVDPVMTAVGGAKKFKEMIQDDIAEAKRLKKKRKESGWKPKAYRGGILANGD